MNVARLESKENVYEFMRNIKYGTNHFKCSEDNLISFLNDIKEIINESCGSKKLLLKYEKDADMLEFAGYTLDDNLCMIVCNEQSELLPSLSKDSLLIRYFLSKAFNSKSLVRFDLDPSLYRYAKKIASNKLIFGVDDEGAFFNGAEKELSVYDKMINAFRAGNDTIEFNSENTSIATIRCYTSTLSKMSGRKIKCAIKEGMITVYLKPITKKDELKRKVQYLLNEFDTEKEGFDLLREILHESTQLTVNTETIKIQGSLPVIASPYMLNGIPVSPQEWMQQPIWIRQGYATEKEMNDDF